MYAAIDIAGLAVGLAIFIACLGLFGLASFTTEGSTKEIGIRKVVGGSVWDIIRHLTGKLGRLVLLANFVAWFAAYFLMHRWAGHFAYRVDMDPWVYVGSGLAALAIAWLTVGAVACARASRCRCAHYAPSEPLRSVSARLRLRASLSSIVTVTRSPSAVLNDTPTFPSGPKRSPPSR